MKKIFYEKVGRKYVPVSEYDSDLLDAMPKGVHIIMSYPGGKSTRYKIDPAYGPMIAAGRVAEDAVCQALHKASEARPKEQPITPRQKAAWEEMKAAFGDEFFSVTLPATRNLAKAAVYAMQEEANKLLEIPSVKKAYEQFLFVAELTKEHHE
jgi:hypothetical protein